MEIEEMDSIDLRYVSSSKLRTYLNKQVEDGKMNEAQARLIMGLSFTAKYGKSEIKPEPDKEISDLMEKFKSTWSKIVNSDGKAMVNIDGESYEIRSVNGST